MDEMKDLVGRGVRIKYVISTFCLSLGDLTLALEMMDGVGLDL